MTSALSDDSFEGLPEDSLKEAIRAALINVHTMLPAQIVSFDKNLQTASVQICIQRVYDGEPQPVAVLPGLPVQFPRGGGYAITFPVKAGDPCMVQFSERSLDKWWETGGCVDPEDPRLFDLADGVVVLGLHSAGEAIPEFKDDAFEIRQLQGDQLIRMDEENTLELTNGPASVKLEDDGTVTIENENGTFTLTPAGGFNFQGAADELLTVLNDLISALEVALVQVGPSVWPFNAATLAALAAVRARLNTLRV